MFKSPYVKNGTAVKAGLRKTKQGFVQRYRCTTTGRYFVKRDGFERHRIKPEIICAALDLRANGLSLAKIQNHLYQHHAVRVSRKTILDWQTKFGRIASKFSQSLSPNLGDVFNADEMFIHYKKEFKYLWACLDKKTKFLVAHHVSNIRIDEEAEEFMYKVKRRKAPLIIRTDNSYNYPPAIRKVFGKEVIHSHYAAHKKQFKNNPIERFNNTARESLKTMRYFKTIKGITSFFNLFVSYYNFCRPHLSLLQYTPALVAGVGVSGRNKMYLLIKN